MVDLRPIVFMTLKHMVLHKKIEELEAAVDKIILHGAAEPGPGNSVRDDRVSRKINFVKKLIADVTVTYAQDRPEDLDEMTDRLSAVENNFNAWAVTRQDEDGGDGTMMTSSCSCTSSCLNEEEDDGEEDRHEKEDAERCSGEVGVEEKMRFDALLSRVNLEDLVMKLAEKEEVKKKRRPRSWFRILGTIGIVAGLGIGIAWLGSMEEGVYLVPT